MHTVHSAFECERKRRTSFWDVQHIGKVAAHAVTQVAAHAVTQVAAHAVTQVAAPVVTQVAAHAVTQVAAPVVTQVAAHAVTHLFTNSRRFSRSMSHGARGFNEGYAFAAHAPGTCAQASALYLHAHAGVDSCESSTSWSAMRRGHKA
jgi:hypothetical protein